MDLASETPAIIKFGHFRVLPHRRELLADGAPVKLGGRAFDILMALIDARGEVVSKDALVARVWPDRSSRRRICTAKFRHCVPLSGRSAS
jgi:DNA-binding winged helix-turn-helix (wHTH) protein